MTWVAASPARRTTGFNGRDSLFLAILAVAWISFSPFHDLGAADNADLGTGNDELLYLAFGLFAVTAGILLWRTDRPALKSLMTPSFLALAGWLAVTCVTSQDPATSLKRATIMGFAGVCGAALFLLPRDRDDMARLLSVVALFIIVVSYLGVLVAPRYAIHQANDISEPQLAGDWRGLFPHKNQASAIFSILAFIGLFVLRTGRKAEGWIIVALSLIFVIASGGKSSTAICLMTMGSSLLAERRRSVAAWCAIVFLPLLVLNLLGVGAVLWPAMAALSDRLPLDTTFTGRTDVWAFGLRKARDTLLFGHGLGAFWNTEAQRYGMEDTTMWAGKAAHAHNGYLDAVLSMGIPGLVLTIAAFVVQPARDVWRGAARDDEAAIRLMFVQIWLFSLYLNALESFFFDRANASWVAFLFAVFGLRYLAEFRVVRAS